MNNEWGYPDDDEPCGPEWLALLIFVVALFAALVASVIL